jgi:hypothetical protein
MCLKQIRRNAIGLKRKGLSVKTVNVSRRVFPGPGTSPKTVYVSIGGCFPGPGPRRSSKEKTPSPSEKSKHTTKTMNKCAKEEK